MQFGLNTMTAGDILNVGTGIWSESLNITKNGSIGSPYTIAGAGTGLTTQITRLEIDTQYYVISGIMFSGCDIVLGSPNFIPTNANFNVINGCLFSHNTQGVWLNEATSDPNATGAPAYNTICNCTFQNPVSPSNGMVRMGGHDNIVSGNIFTKNRGEDATRVGGTGNYIKNNLFLGINNPLFTTGSIYSITSTGDFTAICTVTGNIWDYELDSALGTVLIFGIYPPSYNSLPGASNMTAISQSGFKYTVVGTGGIAPPSGSAIDVSTGSLQAGNHADCMQIFTAANSPILYQNIYFDGNIVMNGYSAQISNVEDQGASGNVQSIHWRNNLIVNSLSLCNIFVKNCTVENNTVYRPSGTLGFRFIGNTPDRGVANSGRVFNNLFIGGEWGAGGPYSLEPGTTGCSGDYNMITTGLIGGSLPVFNEPHGINGGGYLATQIFVDPANGNFHLANGSPVIGSGVDLSQIFNYDIAGNTRTVPWDMGAYVYSIISGVSGVLHLVRMGRHPKFKVYHSS